jgi:hypothetical protein
MKPVLIFIIYLISTLSFAQSEGAKCHPELVGQWTYSDLYGKMELSINADGTCELDGYPMTYTCSNQNLLFSSNGQTETWGYSIDASGLSLLDSNSGTTIKMIKSVTGRANETVGDKSNVLSQSVPVNTVNKQLVGVWVGHNEKIEFKENGVCMYNGLSLNFETTATTLTLKSTAGEILFNYTLLKDQLTLQAQGKTLNYLREGTQASVAPQKAGTTRIAQELVGKWCWTNVTTTNSGGSTSETCIVLNGDGTYTYNSERSMDTNTDAFFAGTNSQSSDFGTWSSDGIRVYYNSQNGQGNGSYQLEKKNHPKTGDPMILLDGEAYVTYFQKNSW